MMYMVDTKTRHLILFVKLKQTNTIAWSSLTRPVFHKRRLCLDYAYKYKLDRIE